MAKQPLYKKSDLEPRRGIKLVAMSPEKYPQADPKPEGASILCRRSH